MSETPLAIVVVAAALAVILALLALRALTDYAPGPIEDVEVEGTTGLPPLGAGDSLRLFTWNIGFGGLGAESDFFADGGRRTRAPSRALVERNVAAITARLRQVPADVFLLEEMARASFMTRGVDVRGAVEEALAPLAHAYTPVVRVTGLPFVGSLEVGSGILARRTLSSASRHGLPSKPVFLGILLQHFNILEARLPVAGSRTEWILLNVHFSAFDDGELRRKQLDEVLRVAQAAYAAGNFVVVGGDWNLRLAVTDFPYSTLEKSKFWVRDIPARAIPADWRWAVDARTPTVRTLERPYQPGVNYTCVIDGFLVSPNVEVLSVETLDLGFAHSDHNPVRIEVRAREAAKRAP